ncbi:MAG: F0F1 ATP synthase subunit A [Deltaproteobacteria bacterium]|jgi:F-type H+-transporting ATPase subunit a|nr:F0F1 ATP synthase subunit A [Deltaproteobacteria bacterium]
MEHPVMLLTWILEKINSHTLGHFAHAYPHLVYTWFFAIIVVILAVKAGQKPTLVPGTLQVLFETVVEALWKFQEGIMGKRGMVFFPMTATLMIFVFFCNFNGLIPGSFAPTSNLNTTLAYALMIVFLTHFMGFKVHGIKYVKHFLGPSPFLAPLMLPVELVSHAARVVSLSFRLFGNILGEDLVIGVLFMLAGQYFLPLPMMFLGLFTGFLQAYIISLLAMVYIGEAMEEEAES